MKTLYIQKAYKTAKPWKIRKTTKVPTLKLKLPQIIKTRNPKFPENQQQTKKSINFQENPLFSEFLQNGHGPERSTKLQSFRLKNQNFHK